MLLLVLDDERGTKAPQFTARALAATAFAELILRRELVHSTTAPNKYAWGTAPPSRNTFLAGVREVIEKKGVDKKATKLIPEIAGQPKLFQPVYDHLVDLGILQRRDHRFLVTWHSYPEKNPSPERELKARLAEVMFQRREPTAQEAVLIALANGIDVLKPNFDNALLREHRDRIDGIAKGEGLAGQAVKDAVAEMDLVLWAEAVIHHQLFFD